MLVEKKQVSKIDQNQLLADVVQAQLTNWLIRPRGKVIVKELFYSGRVCPQLTSPTPATFIQDCNSYCWDFNTKSEVRSFFERLFEGISWEETEELLNYFNLKSLRHLKLFPNSSRFKILAKLKIKMAQLNLRLSQQKETRELLRQFYCGNQSKSELAAKFDLSEHLVNQLIRRFSREGLKFTGANLPKQLEVDQLLLGCAEQILDLFKEGYCLRSMNQIYRELCQLNPRFEIVPRAKFQLFLQKDLKVSFGALKSFKGDIDNEPRKEGRHLISLFLLSLLRSNQLVVFIDESLISESSFRSKAWRLRNSKYLKLKFSPLVGTTNLVLATSYGRIWNYWVCKKMNQQVITSFLMETVTAIRSELGQIPIFVLLDNCPSHRTALVKEFAESFRTFLVFNVSYSSKINPVEYVFEIIKRSFRLRVEKQYRESIVQTLHSIVPELTEIQLRSCYHRAFKAMRNCIDKEQMWLEDE